ncbi:MAG: hypothetical protein LBU23_13130, partial [Planctomycetota bacterium]|nr:hypothetical protein [Planctomycetota bacterium]
MAAFTTILQRYYSTCHAGGRPARTAIREISWRKAQRSLDAIIDAHRAMAKTPVKPGEDPAVRETVVKDAVDKTGAPEVMWQSARAIQEAFKDNEDGLNAYLAEADIPRADFDHALASDMDLPLSTQGFGRWQAAHEDFPDLKLTLKLTPDAPDMGMLLESELARTEVSKTLAALMKEDKPLPKAFQLFHDQVRKLGATAEEANNISQYLLASAQVAGRRLNITAEQWLNSKPIQVLLDRQLATIKAKQNWDRKPLSVKVAEWNEADRHFYQRDARIKDEQAPDFLRYVQTMADAGQNISDPVRVGNKYREIQNHADALAMTADGLTRLLEKPEEITDAFLAANGLEGMSREDGIKILEERRDNLLKRAAAWRNFESNPDLLARAHDPTPAMAEEEAPAEIPVSTPATETPAAPASAPAPAANPVQEIVKAAEEVLAPLLEPATTTDDAAAWEGEAEALERAAAMEAQAAAEPAAATQSDASPQPAAATPEIQPVPEPGVPAPTAVETAPAPGPAINRGGVTPEMAADVAAQAREMGFEFTPEEVIDIAEQITRAGASMETEREAEAGTGIVTDSPAENDSQAAHSAYEQQLDHIDPKQRGRYDFVAAPGGGFDFGIIDIESRDSASLRKAGMETGPVRLENGTRHFGKIHIEREHFRDLFEAGFKNVEDFVKHVVDNFNQIRIGDKGRYIIVAPGNGGRLLALSLHKNGENYYTVTTGYIAREGKKLPGKALWGMDATQPQNSGDPARLLSSNATKTGGIEPLSNDGQSTLPDSSVPRQDANVNIESIADPVAQAVQAIEQAIIAEQEQHEAEALAPPEIDPVEEAINRAADSLTEAKRRDGAYRTPEDMDQDHISNRAMFRRKATEIQEHGATLAESVDAGAYDSHNPYSRKLFEELTGIKLPNGNRNIRQAIGDYIGKAWTELQDRKEQARKDAETARVERDAAAETLRIANLSDGMRAVEDYAKTASPMAGGRIRKTLGKNIWIERLEPTADGGFRKVGADKTTRGDYIFAKISQGGSVKWNPGKTERRLFYSDGSTFMDEKTLSKTGMDFAEWLIGRRDSSDDDGDTTIGPNPSDLFNPPGSVPPASSTPQDAQPPASPTTPATPPESTRPAAPSTPADATPPATPPETPTLPLATPAAQERARLAAAFHKRLFTDSQAIGGIVEARQMASELLGRPVEAGSEDVKMVDEAVELAMVWGSRAIIDQGRAAGKSDIEIFRELVAALERQPGLNSRTSTSVAQQAYSTPIPLAFLASRLAGIDAATTVYEPTAGNGALLIEANPEKVAANEINPPRLAALKAQGFRISENDAAEHQPIYEVDRVIANPPFGTTKGPDGNTKSWKVLGLETSQIDHAIALRALGAMKENGRGVLIIGGKEGNDANRKKKYRTAEQVNFYKTLFDNFKVVA